MRTIAYGLAMALCVVIAAGGCSEQKKNDPMADIRTSGVSQRILDYIDIVLKKGKAKDIRTRDVIDDIAALTNRAVRGKLSTRLKINSAPLLNRQYVINHKFLNRQNV